MLNEMSVRELNTWFAYYGVDPWGEQRADLRTGILVSRVLNSLGADPPVRPVDSMPYAHVETPPQRTEPSLSERIRAALVTATQMPIQKRKEA